MHGPTCIFWANLTAFSLQAKDKAAPVAVISDERLAALQVRLEVLHTARLNH